MSTEKEAKGEEFEFPDEKAKKDEKPPQDELDIEVVDDTPEADRKRERMKTPVQDPDDEELAQYGEKVQKRMKELTRSRHEERRDKEAAQRERDEAVRVAQSLAAEAGKLKKIVHSGQELYAGTAAKAAQAELDAAKAALKKAHEDFDHDAIVAAQEKMTDAKLALARAANFKPAPLQDEKEGVEREERTEPAPKPDEKTLRWQQRNQWFGSDDEMTAVALAAHRQLVQSGTDPRSDDYFRAIDARMRKRFPDFFDDAEPEERAGKREKPSQVVAPVTRTATPKKVRLTQTQVALAAKLGLTPEQYAKELVKLEASNG